MWRTKAVVSLLVEDVAEIRLPESPGRVSGTEDALGGADRLEILALEKARRRALLVGLVDWIALLILLTLHAAPRPFLPFSPTIDTVFTLGVLAVATHSGFRLCQARAYRVISRVCQELWERVDD